VDPGADAITLDGKPVGHQEERVYLILNKPQGVITTTRDTHGRHTVVDCVAGVKGRLFPVGRLDFDVEGALLLTNDGELAYRLMHPKFQVEKVYIARVNGSVSPETALQLEHGVELEDGRTAPARVMILSQGRHASLLRLTLHEGRKREVKRMCAAVGHPLQDLRRVAIGNIRVRGLRPGEWRYLSDNEVAALRKLAGL
jgi:pseudouridine synthase